MASILRKGIRTGTLGFFAALSLLHAQAGSLVQDWDRPPQDAKMRAYWWWLNGNVTREAITRDLEEMKAKGWGGALICDADGSSQDGNDRVPAGPTFFSPEWRELYKFALKEANRLGLEMSLNIQSGWNLGGPMVTADDAARKLTWSETQVSGPSSGPHVLPVPRSRDNYYRDLFVLAYRIKPGAGNVGAKLTSSSEQPSNGVSNAGDGNAQTFWVSNSTEPGGGPTRQKPQWLLWSFDEPFAPTQFLVQGRPEYGPAEFELQVSNDGRSFRSIGQFQLGPNDTLSTNLADISGRHFRLFISRAYDPRFVDRSRNVQVAEFQLLGAQGQALTRAGGAPIENWQAKAMHRALSFSAPDTTPLFQDAPGVPGEEDARLSDVIDLTRSLRKDGSLAWEAPAGDWQVLRIGCTIGDHSRVSTSSGEWQGYALDVMDAGAFTRYWDAVVQPLIEDAGPYAGKTLRFLHTDSWEVEAVNWTPTLRQEFRKRRGYDMLPYLPVLTGKIIDSREVSNRFMHDFRKTLGDLAIDNHFRIFKERAHRHELEIHPESGGPHAVPIDAQRCLGFNDAPMSEFWAWSWRHRVGDHNRFFVKQPASAAHTYGRKLVLAEGFTTIGPHWQERIWDNLKPSFDKAICEGLNLLVWHAVVCSPDSMGMPGQQYFAGTHFNPNTTWWEKSRPFVDYVNRIQSVMQQGVFVADVCYYYGDHVPNFAQRKASDPALVLPGYDYDVITEEVILKRMNVRDGRLVLPDGVSYRIMVLPNRDIISLPVLEKLQAFAKKGAVIVGPKAARASTLRDYPAVDRKVQQIASELWDSSSQARVISGREPREVLSDLRVPPDFEAAKATGPDIDYIHRKANNADIYFVANRSNRLEEVECTFRVSGKAPELWNPVTGERRKATRFTQQGGRTTVPLRFEPCGSWIVVFREPARGTPAGSPNVVEPQVLATLEGPWQVQFDPLWGGPAEISFDQLTAWNKNSDLGVKYYSGKAVYRKNFTAPAGENRLYVDLGDVRELAEVRLNGKSLGIVWTPPFRVDLSPALKPGENTLEVEVVNFWPNRIIGDRVQKTGRTYTKTNIRKLTQDSELMDSGLLGPVTLRK